MPAGFETYSKFAGGAVQRGLARCLPHSQTIRPYRVQVLNGLHAGSTTTFSESSVDIGPDQEFDVMLVDDDLLDSEAVLKVEMSLVGPLVTLMSTHEDAGINGTPVQPFVETAPARMPCTLRFGAVEIRVSDADDDGLPLKRYALEFAPPLLMSVGLFALAFAYVMDVQTRSPIELVSDASVQQVVAAPAPPEGAQRVAMDAVAEAGLQDFLAVALDASDTVSITGNLPERLMPAWQKTRQQMDAQTDGAVFLADVKAIPGLRGLPPVSAVRLGERPRIYFADGTSAAVGDLAIKDWRIDRIEATALTIRRNTEVAVVNF